MSTFSDHLKAAGCELIAAGDAVDEQPPPLEGPTDPTRGGFRKIYDAELSTATEEDKTFGVQEGEPDGVSVGGGQAAIKLREGDRQWKAGTSAASSRSEITLGGIDRTKLRNGQTKRFVERFETPEHGEDQLYFQDGILDQLASTSGANQSSPCYSLRRWASDGGSQIRFQRENEQSRSVSIGPPITLPSAGVLLHAELEVFASTEADGYARQRLWRLDTGEELTTEEHWYRGPTQIGRDGHTYNPRSVTFYRKAGAYGTGKRRPGGAPIEYALREMAVYAAEDDD